jgi:hypothetical protein
VQPRRKGRLSPKCADFAKELKESLLHQVFRIRRIIDHPQAQSVDAAAVKLVQKLKSRGITGLGQTDGNRLSQRLG